MLIISDIKGHNHKVGQQKDRTQPEEKSLNASDPPKSRLDSSLLESIKQCVCKGV